MSDPTHDQNIADGLEIAAKYGPEKFLHYRAFPMGYDEGGARLHLAFPRSLARVDLQESARKISTMTGCARIVVTIVDDETMRFYEKRLASLTDNLAQRRVVVTDADRKRAAQMAFDESTMVNALKVVTEEVAYQRDVIGLVYDIDSQSLLVGSENDTADFIEDLKGVIRVKNIFVRKMPIREVRESIKRLYAKSTATAASDMKRILDEIIAEALRRHAADIAFEYNEAAQLGTIRFAIDNDFHDSHKYATIDPETFRRLVEVTRNSAAVRPADANECGDGKMTRTLEGREVSLRVNTMPYRGLGFQRVSIRLLSNMVELRRLDGLGLSKHVYRQFGRAMRRPGAFNVIAGPVGEGKTTTGYTVLKTFVDFAAKNVISIEDPIEYPIKGINQFQITADERTFEDTGKGLTFSRLLRACLRQYPQYIFLGEIRDDETANESMRAATTGISLLSTIHANDAVQALNRLQAFGISRFDLAQNLTMTSSQRLIMKLCDNCKEPARSLSQEAKRLAFTFSVDIISGSIMRAREGGCRMCDGRGYRDRIAAFEVLEVNAIVAEAIENKEIGTVAIAQLAVENGYRPMAVAALEHLVNGVTSEEAILAKLSFSDAQRYVNSRTTKVTYHDPDEQVIIEADERVGDDLLGGTSALSA